MRTRKNVSADSVPGWKLSGGFFDVAGKQAAIADLQRQTEGPAFWNDNVAAQKVMQQMSGLKVWVEAWTRLDRALGDGSSLVELAEEAGDESMGAEIARELTELEQGVADLEQQLPTVTVSGP